MNSFIDSLSIVCRRISRRRGFTAAVVATLALGIAPNLVIFAIMDAIYFRPLPYPAQERLVLLNVARPDSGALAGADGYSFGEWRSRSRGFAGLAAYRGAGLNVTVGSRPERLAGQGVSADFFSVLGVAPAIGRTITAADCAPGAPPVIVISHQAWKEQFDGGADVLNRGVRLNGAPATVVGVMPASFTSFMEGRAARAWVPLSFEPRTAPGGDEVNVIGRLKADTSMDQAQSEMSGIETTLVTQFADALRARRAVVRDFRASLFSGLGPGLRMLRVIVGLLLVIACANAANLLIGRAAAQVREVALRSAIGASRFRLAVSQLVECLVLAAAGAVVGLLIAAGAVAFVWARFAPLFTRIGVNAFAFDGRVVAFASALAGLTTVVFGLGPAIRGSRADVSEVLKTGAPASGTGRRTGRLARALVVCQVALCVVTLVVATLMTRSFTHFARLSSDPGFDASRLVVATLPAPTGAEQPGARAAAVREIEARVAAAPGVEAVGVTNRMPFLEAGTPSMVALGPDAPGSVPRFDAELRAVNAAYMKVTSTRLQRGRGIGAEDTAASQPVVLIDERLSQAAFGAFDPIGRHLFVDGVERVVVGVVRNSVAASPFRPPAREIFVPASQTTAGEVKLLVRSRLADSAAASEVRRAVAAVDADEPVVGLQPMAAALDDFMTPFRLILSLITLFGLTALGLAAVGLYGVIARGVARRTREIGVRMAKGASRPDIVTMNMREGLRSAGVGLALGLAIGMAAARLIPSEILGANGLAPWHYLGAIVVWAAAAAVACAVPARRAARVEPIAALRCD
jgi:putative ABC transport system permease protein